MFLGWVCNVLYLAFIYNHIEEDQRKLFVRLFVVLQVLIAGMLVAFPLQGYGLYSIIFSTLHTLGMVLFAVLFFRKSIAKDTASWWFARMALIFFILSAAGPFSLGYIMTLGPAHRDWYYFSIYYYLHFQYNGFFTFGILSLFFRLLELKHFSFDTRRVIMIGRLLAIACVPAYFLSILWAKPGVAFNVAGGMAAAAQVYAFALLIELLSRQSMLWYNTFKGVSHWVLNIVLACAILKLLLQCVSAVPYVAAMAYQLRTIVIAYLHLFLIGGVTLFLLVWYRERGFLKVGYGAFVLIVFAFVGMEIVLVLTPWWSFVDIYMVFTSAVYTFVSSIALALGFLTICIAAIYRNV
jgi:hypothetical protein